MDQLAQVECFADFAVEKECAPIMLCMDEAQIMPRSANIMELEEPSFKKMSKGGGGMRKMMAPLSRSIIQSEQAPVVIERYKKAGAAFEYGERHQFFDGSLSKGEINDFWLSIM